MFVKTLILAPKKLPVYKKPHRQQCLPLLNVQVIRIPRTLHSENLLSLSDP